MEDRIFLIPCRASYFLLGRFEDYDQLILFFVIWRCNSSYSLNCPSTRGEKLIKLGGGRIIDNLQIDNLQIDKLQIDNRQIDNQQIVEVES